MFTKEEKREGRKDENKNAQKGRINAEVQNFRQIRWMVRLFAQ